MNNFFPAQYQQQKTAITKTTMAIKRATQANASTWRKFLVARKSMLHFLYDHSTNGSTYSSVSRSYYLLYLSLVQSFCIMVSLFLDLSVFQSLFPLSLTLCHKVFASPFSSITFDCPVPAVMLSGPVAQSQHSN